MVDTEGLVIQVTVSEANHHDGKMAASLLEAQHHCFPRLEKIWADQAYRGDFVTEGQRLGIDIEIVEHAPNQVGFAVLPR